MRRSSLPHVAKNVNDDPITIFRLEIYNRVYSLSSTANDHRTNNDVSLTSPLNKHSTNVGTSLLYSDEIVNVWEFRLLPGESCPYHQHQYAYIFVNLSDSSTLELDLDGKPVVGAEPNHQRRGKTVYVPFSKVGSHAVRNVGNTTFLQFIVEYKHQHQL